MKRIVILSMLLVLPSCAIISELKTDPATTWESGTAITIGFTLIPGTSIPMPSIKFFHGTIGRAYGNDISIQTGEGVSATPGGATGTKAEAKTETSMSIISKGAAEVLKEMPPLYKPELLKENRPSPIKP